MCDPATLAVAGLNAVQSFAAIGDQNAAAAANRQNALRAQNDQIDSEGQSFVEQNRALIQGGFDAVLGGRHAEADAYTSAIYNGVQGASVKAMMRDKGMVASRNQNRAADEVASLGTQASANFKHISSQTRGKISSVPFTSFGIGDVAGILTPIAKSQMD